MLLYRQPSLISKINIKCIRSLKMKIIIIYNLEISLDSIKEWKIIKKIKMIKILKNQKKNLLIKNTVNKWLKDSMSLREEYINQTERIKDCRSHLLHYKIILWLQGRENTIYKIKSNNLKKQYLKSKWNCKREKDKYIQ